MGSNDAPPGRSLWSRLLFWRRPAPVALARPVPRGDAAAKTTRVAPLAPPPGAAAGPWDELAASLTSPQELARDAALPHSLSADEHGRLVALVRGRYEENRPGPASFPPIASQIVEIVEKPDVDFNHIVRLVSQDPAVVAAILRTANSPHYRRGTEVNNIRNAVSLLGMKEVARVAIGEAGRSLFDMEANAEQQTFAPLFASLFHRAMTSAFASSWLAMEVRLLGADGAFLAGMFHDIGKPVALRALASLCVTGKLATVPDARAAERVLEDLHVAIGGELVGVWALPQVVVDACRLHHADDVPTTGEGKLVHVVRVVSGLVAIRAGDLDPELRRQLRASTSALGMNRYAVRALITQIGELAGTVSTMFGVRDPGAEHEAMIAGAAAALAAPAAGAPGAGSAKAARPTPRPGAR